jgi:hypothetical protein
MRAMKNADGVQSTLLGGSESVLVDVRESQVVLLDNLITFPVEFTASEDKLVHAQRMRSDVLNPPDQSVFMFNDVLPIVIFSAL